MGIEHCLKMSLKLGVTKGVLSLGIVIIILALPLSPSESAAAHSATSCGQTLGEKLYSAHFDWKVGSQPTSSALQLVIAQNLKPGFHDSKYTAQILTSGLSARCQAICQVEKFDATTHSMDMSCKSSGFGALAAPATVFFRQPGTPTSPSVLRFGTWVQGYEQSVLNIDVDHSTQLLKEMNPQPLQLARSR